MTVQNPCTGDGAGFALCTGASTGAGAVASQASTALLTYPLWAATIAFGGLASVQLVKRARIRFSTKR